MLPTPFDSQDLQSDIEAPYLERGRNYFAEGRVLDYRIDGDGRNGVVSGEVRGSGDHVYQVYVQLIDNGRDSTVIEGDCTCPVGFNCKHVAAILLAALAGQPAAPPPQPAVEGVEAWVSRLSSTQGGAGGSATARLPDAYPADVDERLLFVLSQSPGVRGRLRVGLRVGRLLTGGGYGQSYEFAIQRAWEPYPPRYLLAADLALLRRLATLAVPDTSGFALQGSEADALLEDLIATGRCHWLHPENPALRLGPLRAATAAWDLGDDGMQQLVFHSQPEFDAVLALAPPWYLDFAEFLCGRIDSGLPAATAGVLAEAPVVAPGMAAELAQRLRAALPEQEIPLPAQVEVVELAPVSPTPVLYMTRIANLATSKAERTGPPAVRLEFDYHGHRINSDNALDAPWLRHAEGLVRIQRDFVVERGAAQRLRSLGLRPWNDRHKNPVHDSNSGCWVPFGLEVRPDWWFEFQGRALGRLRGEAWRVEYDPGFPFRIVEAGPLAGELKPRDDQDWFDLALDVEVDGEYLPLLPMLTAWLQELPSEQAARTQIARLREGESLLLPMPDGRRLALPPQRVAALLETLVELYNPRALDARGRLRFSRWQLPQLQSLPLDTAARNQVNENLLGLGRRLREFSGVETAPPPAGFRAVLRPYQQQGLNWLQFLREYGFGGILADDMGLGKTVQTLAHLAIEKASGRADRPSLVVAPTSLLFNWRREAAEFAPQLSVLVLHGPDRHRQLTGMERFDLIVTSYPLLVRDADFLKTREFHLLILDEAQTIKNPRAQVARTAGELQARYRLCLTGTPLENHLGELWSLFNFLAPGFLGDERQFRRLFRNPIEKHGDHQRQASLGRRVAPFILRRSKREVAAELPPKTEILRSVELEGDQRDLYETVRLALHRKLRESIERKGLERSHIEVLDALLKLRQICCDPRLVKLEQAQQVQESAKLQLLMDLLPEMVEEGRRVLLFSQFTSMLGLIEEAVSRLGIDYVKLTGRTRDRATPVDRFQNGEVPLFLISLKAGGTGLNLTAADTVIHYDPWWNPAVEDQASDRAHRIGQTKPVFVYKLITEGTVEEKILALQQSKRALVEGLFQHSGRLDWSADDLLQLLAPAEPAP